MLQLPCYASCRQLLGMMLFVFDIGASWSFMLQPLCRAIGLMNVSAGLCLWATIMAHT